MTISPMFPSVTRQAVGANITFPTPPRSFNLNLISRPARTRWLGRSLLHQPPPKAGQRSCARCFNHRVFKPEYWVWKACNQITLAIISGSFAQNWWNIIVHTYVVTTLPRCMTFQKHNAGAAAARDSQRSVSPLRVVASVPTLRIPASSGSFARCAKVVATVSAISDACGGLMLAQRARHFARSGVLKRKRFGRGFTFLRALEYVA